MAEDLSNIPSFEEFYQAKTGSAVQPLQQTTATEHRIPTWEEYAQSQGLTPYVTNLPTPPEEEPGEFSKGLSRGWRELQALSHGALGAIADTVGANDFAQRRIEDYTRLMQEAEQFSPEVGSIEEIDSPGKFISWAAGTLGEQIPNIASIMLSGGVTGLTGRVLAKQGLTGAAKKLAEQQLATKIAQWGTRGAIGGTYLGASALETGGIFGEQVEAGVEPQGGVALLGGGVAGSLEVLPFITVARRLGFGDQAKGILLQRIKELSLPKRILATGALVGGQESGTEAAQEIIALAARDFVDQNYEALGPEGRSRILNSAAAGGLLGFMFGAPAGVRRGAAAEEYAPDIPPVEIKTPPQVTATEQLTETTSEQQAEFIVPQKTPYSETYILDSTGLQPAQDTKPSEIIVNSAGLTDTDIKTTLESLVERINQEEKTPNIFVPEEKTQQEFQGVYLPESKFNKTIIRLQKALDNALQDYGVDLDTALSDSYNIAYRGRAKRVSALVSALEAAKQKRYTEVGGETSAPDNGSNSIEAKEKVSIPADIPPSETVIDTTGQEVKSTGKAKRLRPGRYTYAGWDIEKIPGTKHWSIRQSGTEEWTDAANTLTEAKKFVERMGSQTDNTPSENLTFAQQKRLSQLQEKEQLEGLSEREYAVMEKLLALQEGEQAAPRERTDKQKETAELEQLIKETHRNESIKSDVKPRGKEGFGPGISHEDLVNVVKQIAGKLKNLPMIKIVNSLDLYDTNVADQASRSRGLYQTLRDGRAVIYLIEDNIPNAQAAARTLMHELIAHHGLRAFLTPEQLNSFKKLVRDGVDITPFREHYASLQGNMTDEQFDLLVAEEYVARIAEDGTNMSLLNRVIAWIKANLRKWFPDWSKRNIDFTNEDIRYMLRNVHEFLRGRLKGNNPLGIKAHVGKSGKVYNNKTAAQADAVVSDLADNVNPIDPELEIADAVNNLGNAWGVKFSKMFLTPLQIAERYGIAPVKKYIDAAQKFWADKAGIISEADELVTEWRTLGKQSAQRVAKAIFEISEESDIKESRLSDGFVNDKLLNEYKLTEEEVDLYWKIDTSMKELLDRLERGVKYNAAKETLNGDPTEFLQEWENSFSFQERQELVEKYTGADGITDLRLFQRMNEIQEQFDLMRNRNYFPRMRFGRYTIAVRAGSSGVINGEDVDAKELVHFEAFESEKARRIGMKAIEEEFSGQDVYIQQSKLSDEAFTFMGLPPALRQTLARDINLSPEQEELLKDVFIKMSPGRSFMKHLRRRRGTAGYSEDAMRVYASYMMSAANHMSRIENFADLQAPIAEMREWERTARHLIPDNTSLVELREYFEEHLDYIMNPKNDWAKFRAMGFLWYLGLNPKSAMVNASQILMVTFPYLASRYGDGRAMNAIVDSYKRVSKTLRGRGPGVLTEDESMLFTRLLEEGVLDESQVMELAGIAEAPSLFRVLPEQADTRIINKLSYVGGWMFRHVEKFNRRVAALSAYKLAKDSGLSTEEAYQAAKTAVQTTQYEYAKWNRPKFMRGRRSVIFLFWQYLQHTSYLMAGGAGKQTAMRMWLMMLTMSGMLGLPFAEDMLDLIDWGGTKVKELTGMKNPKVDIREDIRSLLTSITDNPDIFLHGLGRYYGLGPLHVLEALGLPIPNVDVSGSLSLGRIIPGVHDATATSNNPNEKFGRVMMDILGPVGAMGFNMWKALESNDPDSWKKWERAMPVAMKNASKGARWIARGEETSKTGATILDFDPYDYQQQAEKVAQFFGFTPTRIKQQYDVILAQEEAKRYWMARRSILMGHFGYAKLLHDQEGIADARAAIRDYNRTIPDNALRITGKDLALSIKQRRRIKSLTEAGLPPQKRYRHLFAEKAELYPESNR